MLPPVHPHLHFVSHLQRSIKGEQLIAQLFRCIPDQSWLYKFGRVPMSFVMSDWVWTVRMPVMPPYARPLTPPASASPPRRTARRAASSP